MSDNSYDFKALPKGFIGSLDSLSISSKYGYRQSPTGGGGTEWHNGVDIVVPVGTVLMSPVNGTIVKVATQENGAGLYVTIKAIGHRGVPYYLVFMHMHKVEVREGDATYAFTRIGLSGGDPNDKPNCGRSTGPHIHFEVRIGSNDKAHSVDPMRFLTNHECTVRQRVGGITSYHTIPAQPEKENILQSNLSTRSANEIGTELQSPELMDNPDWNATETIEQREKQPTTTEERLAPGIWQIIKILIDSSVENKQIADSSISIQTGSLLNFFNKVCQQPFVEFMGDTYGSQYYFIARRPPFDHQGYRRMMDVALTDISDDAIINMDLAWSTTGIYSWYQLQPMSDFGATDVRQLFPAVYFPDYAAIWGSKPLVIQSNYYNYVKSGIFNSSNDENKDENVNNIVRQAVADFRFIIEANAYNPFSRSGSVTIRGNRRIKRGTLVKLPTDEIYHVDSVAHAYSVTIGGVSRTTTLQLSRGIFQDFVDPTPNENNVMCSYFNIIDFGDYKESDITANNYHDILSKWHVNREVFNWFATRKQVLFEQNMELNNRYLGDKTI